jgi:hypothetical protein
VTQAVYEHPFVVRLCHWVNAVSLFVQVTGLLESIVSQVQDGVRSGLSLADTKKKVNVDGFRAPLTGGEEHAMRAFDGFVPVAIERAYLEAKETANRQ